MSGSVTTPYWTRSGRSLTGRGHWWWGGAIAVAVVLGAAGRFRELGDSGLADGLPCWVATPSLRGRVVHDPNRAVFEGFRDAGVDPFPERDVRASVTDDGGPTDASGRSELTDAPTRAAFETELRGAVVPFTDDGTRGRAVGGRDGPAL